MYSFSKNTNIRDIYRFGKVLFRHGGYNKIEYFVNGKEVGLY